MTVDVGDKAPAFTMPTDGGGKVSLAAHRGKVVVLEWFNPDCPFVNQAHLEGNLKGLAKKHPEVVWIAINSNAAGKQGHEPERNRAGRERFGIDYPIALDADGAVGKAYGATRTPEIYVIDPEGNLVYRGALAVLRAEPAPDLAVVAPAAEGEVAAAHVEGGALLAGQEHRLGVEATTRPQRDGHEAVALAEPRGERSLAPERAGGPPTIRKDGKQRRSGRPQRPE